MSVLGVCVWMKPPHSWGPPYGDWPKTAPVTIWTRAITSTVVDALLVGVVVSLWWDVRWYPYKVLWNPYASLNWLTPFPCGMLVGGFCGLMAWPVMWWFRWRGWPPWAGAVIAAFLVGWLRWFFWPELSVN